MLAQRWKGGKVFNPVKFFQAVPSHSYVPAPASAQIITSLLRSVSNAAVGVRQPTGVLSTDISCHWPFWYCQKSLKVVKSSVPPYDRVVLLTGSVVNAK